ncbi:MAG: sugar transferase [Pirellulales bacterium]|nr:sugar transferase [Pirellulales bacterium]
MFQFLIDELGTAATLNLLGDATHALDWLHSGERTQASGNLGTKTAVPSWGDWPSASVLPLIAADGNLSIGYQRVKRCLDVAGAAVLLVLLAPILLAALVALSMTTRGRPLFSQERVGLCGRRFRMWKFRTMRLDADKLQHLVQNDQDGPIFKNRRDPRITKLGRILRKTSIDEMPQLVNVLLGDMSLVGPRPPVPKEVDQYKTWQKRRLSVKPGLTCKWQISGRSDIGFEDWVRMDLWYVQHQGLWTDLGLLIRTPLKVISCEGAY